MKKIGRVILFAVLMAVIITGFSSCGLKKSVEITNVGWVIENIDKDFWSNPPSSNRLGIRFFVYFSCTGCDESALRSLRITAPNGIYWTIAIDSSNTNEENDYINVFLVDNSNNYTTMRLGGYEFDLEVDGGGSGGSVSTVWVPGSHAMNGETEVCSEDYPYAMTSSDAEAVRRAVIGIRTKDADSVALNFSTTSTICFSGWAQFYDSNGTYVGNTPSFRSFDTDLFAGFLNGGANVLYTDGNNNVVDVPFSQINFVTGYSSVDISSFAMMLTDGAQYPGTSGTYDCISITERTSF